MDWQSSLIIQPTIQAIKFKRTILTLDIQSRTVVLKKCLKLFENSEDEMDIKCHIWLQQLLSILCDETEKDMRKNEAKSPDIWKVLFDDLCSHQKFWNLAIVIGNI